MILVTINTNVLVDVVWRINAQIPQNVLNPVREIVIVIFHHVAVKVNALPILFAQVQNRLEITVTKILNAI